MIILNRRSFLLMAGLAVIMAAIVMFQRDANKRVAHFRDMMESQGQAVADIVAESSLHGVNTFNSWENEVNQRLVNNALWLVWLDTHGGLDSAHLRDFANTMDLHRILVFRAKNGSWPGRRALMAALRLPAPPSRPAIPVTFPVRHRA